MGVYLGVGKTIDDYSAIQGPCPDNFHVPLGNELNGLVNIATSLGLNASQFSQYFKLPLSGYINRTGGAIYGRGSFGYIRSSSTSNDYSDKADIIEIFSTSSYRFATSTKSTAIAIRPFKNTSLSPDGSWVKLYQGAGNSGIYWNSSLGLITASSDGITWITIADKNLGATTVWNSGDTLSEANCGKYYQRGNNYGFQGTGPSITSSTKVDANNYGPGNYYSSNTFITVSASPYDWSSVQNDNLRGGETGVQPKTVYPELKNAYIGIPYPTSIVLNKSAISLTAVGQTSQLTATIEPTVSDKTITWSSDDTTIATVSTTGLVTCVTPGECTITATTVNGLTASCSVAERSLPSAYQEVEWIGSSGSQYINTGFTPTVNTSIVTSLSLGSNSGWAVFFGVTGNDSSSDGVLGRIYADTAGSFNPWFCNANYDETIAYISTDVFHDIELSANTLYIDGNSYTITTTGTPYQSSMDLFAGNNGGSHGWRKSSCKIKSFTIEDSGNTVRDFIPCYRIADGVIGMYDVVNDVFYTNNGSGTFTKGADVN